MRPQSPHQVNTKISKIKEHNEKFLKLAATEVTLSTAPPIISSSRSTTSPHDGTTSVNPKADVVSTEPTAEQLPFSSSPITPAEQSSSTSSSGSGDETIIAGDKSIFLKGTTAEDEVTAVKFNETERTTNTPAEATVLKFKDVGPHPDPDQSPSNTNGSSHSEHPTPPPPAIQIEEEEEESTTSSIPTDTINSEGNVTTTTPSPKTGLSDENATEPSSAATSSADVELSKEPFDSHKLPVQFSTDTEGSTTDIPKIGGTEESGNLTVDLVPQTSVTDHPEPFVDLSVTNNSNNASSHDHEHHNHEHNEEEPSPMETEMAKAVRTSFSIRFPDIEFRPEFADSSSGQFRKFRDQIINEVFYRTENTIKIVALKLRTVLKEALGRDNFIDFGTIFEVDKCTIHNAQIK
jgi:hypothetical protein